MPALLHRDMDVVVVVRDRVRRDSGAVLDREPQRRVDQFRQVRPEVADHVPGERHHLRRRAEPVGEIPGPVEPVVAGITGPVSEVADQPERGGIVLEPGDVRRQRAAGPAGLRAKVPETADRQVDVGQVDLQRDADGVLEDLLDRVDDRRLEDPDRLLDLPDADQPGDDPAENPFAHALEGRAGVLDRRRRAGS